MAKITYDLPPSAFAALHLSPKEFAREMRIAACVQWYAQGLVSQERAAEIAGMGRAEFIAELLRRKIPTCQMTLEELVAEIEQEQREGWSVHPINSRLTAIQYAQLRLEGLIKLARASVRVRLTGDDAAADSAHQWILRYGQLLIQILLGRIDFAEEEHRLLSELLHEVPLCDPELRRRALALFANRHEDCRIVRAGGALYKAGVSSISAEQLDRYTDWMKTTLPRPDRVVAILSRGLPDALLAGELLRVPVCAVCVSLRRLGLDEVLTIDLPHLPGASALVVDAHCRTGKTLAQCWSFLEARGVRVLGALITQDEGGEETLLPSWVRTRARAGWSLITPTDRR